MRERNLVDFKRGKGYIEAMKAKNKTVSKKAAAAACGGASGKLKKCARKAGAEKSCEKFMPIEEFVQAAFSPKECKEMAKAQIIKTAMKLLNADEKSAKKIASKLVVEFPKIDIALKK